MVSGEFPSVRLIRRRGEPAFGAAVNLGMSSAAGKYLLLLNNDTLPAEGSFQALLNKVLKSDDSVAVAVPSIPRPDGTDDSEYRWRFHRGLAVTGQSREGQRYPSGACALWKREIWNSLGGIDARYAPIYWEDADLGVRMHEMGYEMILCPDISVKHLHASTMGASLETLVLRERNRFIFMAANCHGKWQVFSTSIWLPLHLLIAAVKGNRAFIDGYRSFRKWRKRG
jgi:GT2 family glycosyltransferase